MVGKHEVESVALKKMGSSGKFDRKLNPVIREVQPCVQESSSRCSEYYSATGCRIVLVYIYVYSIIRGIILYVHKRVQYIYVFGVEYI